MPGACRLARMRDGAFSPCMLVSCCSATHLLRGRRRQMKPLRTTCVGLVVACFGAIACGSSSSNPGGGDGGGGAASTAGASNCTWSACSLLSAAAVNQALQSNVSAGTEKDTTGLPGLPNFYACEFATPDSSAFLSLSIGCNVANLANNASLYMSINSGQQATPVTLAGTDAAFWIRRADASTSPFAGILDVYFGGHSQFSLTVLLPSTSPVNAQAACTQLATSVVGSL